ncbi:IS110 family transposase [Variovorax paradoxus]|uniref:Transposase n=1 Tax=Variovorax paradoxus TaxID=34073 RepID=A0A0H2LUB1_VARPD|nr:IS110 family transposase [Variovorax paradoxus]KLN52047.1 transposase [Variovorax paradoxus]
MSTNACSNVFAGLDWAVHTHAVCVIDTTGAVLERFEIAHDREGLSELMRRLARLGARVRIAIERPSGLIVDALVEAAHHVFPIHPNAVKASRPRYRSHGAKSDASDAYLLADLLRTDGHRWRELSPQSDSIRALRALVRSRDDLVSTRVALGNQLRSQLEAFWPGAACIFCDITSPIGLAFLQRYPSPTSAARLSEAALRRFCRSQHYSGRRSPAELLARLNSATAGLAGPLATDAAGQLVRSMVAVLQPLVEQIAELTRRIERFVESPPDGQIIMSFPRAGRVCAAQILAELGDVRERFPTLDQLAAEAGAVPVTYQSGKTPSVAFRWACNHRLRQAITCLADNSRHANEWAHAIYAAARARGCDHPHAIRILARAWLRVIWRAWTDRTPYDPARHLGALKLVSDEQG